MELGNLSTKTDKGYKSNVAKSRVDSYVAVGTDLLLTGLMPFLPFDKELNPDGDKYSTKNETIENIGLLASSLNDGINYFNQKYNLSKIDGKTSKLKQSEIKNKESACNSLLSLSRVEGKPFDKDSIVGGALIKRLASSIPLEDSKLVSEYFDDLLSVTFSTIYDFVDKNNENAVNINFEQPEKEYILNNIENAIKEVKKEYTNDSTEERTNLHTEKLHKYNSRGLNR